MMPMFFSADFYFKSAYNSLNHFAEPKLFMYSIFRDPSKILAENRLKSIAKMERVER